MIRSVAAFVPYPWRHPVSTLRVVEPLKQAGIQLLYGSDAGQNHLDPSRLNVLLGQAEAVLFQREFPAYSDDYAWIAGQARARGKPVIYEIDDLLFDLPGGHPDRVSHYYTRALWPMLEAAIQADLVTTTTAQLAGYLRAFNPNVTVLPNYLPDSLWTGEALELPTETPGPVVIGYMGSNTHSADLEEISLVLEGILGERGERVRCRFWGAPPPVGIRGLANVEWIPLEQFDYAEFAAYFRRQRCDLFIAPLADNTFNQCKSAIKFLEYSILGIPGVYSRMATYQAVVEEGRNGLLAGPAEEWSRCLKLLVDDPGRRVAMGRAARESVEKDWLLSQHAGEWERAYQKVGVQAGGRELGSEGAAILSAVIAQVENWRDDLDEGPAVQRLSEGASAEEALAGLKAMLAKQDPNPAFEYERGPLPCVRVRTGGEGEGPHPDPLPLGEDEDPHPHLTPALSRAFEYERGERVKASIIVLTYNNLRLTRMCLESILANTPGSDDEREACPYELVLVDNGSSDGTPEYLRSFAQAHSNVKVILNSHNLGFAHGNNQGAAAATGEILVFLNNDTFVTSGWLDGLERALQDPKVGMAGPVTNSIGNQACIQVNYGDIADLAVFAESYTAAHRGVIFEIEMLALFCAAIRRAVFAEIGPLDEQFETGMFEDDDYAMRLHAQGYRLVCTEEVFIHHWGGAGFHLLGALHYLEIFRANLERFEEKWQIRWSPPLFRKELRGQQMRGLVDDKLQLAGELRAQQAAMAERESKIIEVERENARLRILLNGTYASRGWKLVASLQRARGRLFPNGSRRDRALRACGRAGLGLWRLINPALSRAFEYERGERVEAMENLARCMARSPQANGVAVFVPTIPWDVPLYQRPHQLAAALARQKYLVFFCETVHGSPTDFVQVSPYFYRLINVDLELFKAGLKDQRTGRRLPVIVFTLAYNTHYLNHFEDPIVIYEMIDELEVLPGNLQELQHNHAIMVQTADVITATADVLYRRIRSVREDVVLVPNAVDFDFFQETLANVSEPPADLRKIVGRNQPVIGYYGALAKWFDYGLVAQAALARPDYQFVLIGPDYDGSFSASLLGQGHNRREFPNVSWLGIKPYASLPGYLKYFDVATIPFEVNEITKATSPLKLFEYMAGQKPVVSTGLPECKKYPVVLIAETPQEYVEKLDQAIPLEADPVYREQLLETARQNTWNARAGQILQAVESANRNAIPRV